MAKKKLKTMNEISADEAVKLFKAALRDVDWDRDPEVYFEDGLPVCPDPRRFPKDIAAKDFLESLVLYRQMCIDVEERANDIFAREHYDEQIDEVANIAANIPEKDLEELLNQLTPTQRKVFDLMVDGSHPQLKDFMNDKALISKKGEQMAEGTIKTHVSAICKIFGVPNRKALAAKVKPLLPPKAKA